MSLKLSVLFLEPPPDDVPAFVSELDQLGYHRLWLTEHHNGEQSASPTVMAAIAACHTKALRIGTAGVLLELQHPIRVAQDFRVLEAVFPGRIDLGVAGAVPGGPIGRALLDGRDEPGEYPRKVRDLVALVRGEGVVEGVTKQDIGPAAMSVPDVWLCGTTVRSALLAAELGVAYAFHHHQAARGCEAGAEIVRVYRHAFRPTAHLAVPRVNVACMGLCAPTDSQAEAIWSGTVGTSYQRAPDFCGEAARCRDQLLRLQAAYEVDELVLSSCAKEGRDRIVSYRHLAAATQV